jgi:hypothetical protein
LSEELVLHRIARASSSCPPRNLKSAEMTKHVKAAALCVLLISDGGSDDDRRTLRLALFWKKVLP